MAKRKLLNRSKRPPTNGCRLNDEEFEACFHWKDACCGPLGFNGHRTTFFFGQHYFTRLRYLQTIDLLKPLVVFGY